LTPGASDVTSAHRYAHSPRGCYDDPGRSTLRPAIENIPQVPAKIFWPVANPRKALQKADKIRLDGCGQSGNCL
jgi:hypothetical protein